MLLNLSKLEKQGWHDEFIEDDDEKEHDENQGYCSIVDTFILLIFWVLC